MKRMPNRLRGGLTAAALVLAGALGEAAPAQTVADVRAELDVLNGQIQELRDQLVQQGAGGGLPVEPATALARLDQLEAELRRLTGRVDVLTNDLDRIVQDASNRVGDIEFRLDELEGVAPEGATAAAPAEPLGGGITKPRPRPRTDASGGGTQLAVSEQADFDAAMAAAQSGAHSEAARLFETFLVAYPDGPLSGEARLRRSEALAAQQDWSAAARSYLDAFSAAPEGPHAPQALLGLGNSLSRLGQTGQACLTLDEVGIRYPGSAAAGEAATRRASLACP
jgi:tol-pal system protein YbgF